MSVCKALSIVPGISIKNVQKVLAIIIIILLKSHGKLL